MSKVKSIVSRRTVAEAKRNGDAHRAGTEVTYRDGELTISNKDAIEKTHDQEEAESLFSQIAKWFK